MEALQILMRLVRALHMSIPSFVAELLRFEIHQLNFFCILAGLRTENSRLRSCSEQKIINLMSRLIDRCTNPVHRVSLFCR